MSDVLEIVSVVELEGELGIAWGDGVESFLSWGLLRDSCPCAVCAGEPDVMGRVWGGERKRVSEEGYRLREWRRVGNYALQLVWGDGHDTGLYSFQYLRSLGELGATGSGGVERGRG
jgi:DUF971 family protein